MSGTAARRFSLLAFAVALVTVGAGTAAGLAFVPVAGTYLGILLGGFVSGLALEDRPVLEAGVAAVLAGLGVLLAGALPGNGLVAAVLAVASIPPTTLLVSVALSFAVGAFGGHFGNDLRDGLTDPVEASDPAPTVFESAGSPLPTESSEVERAEDDLESRRSRDSDRSREPDDTETTRETEDDESTDVEFEYE